MEARTVRVMSYSKPRRWPESVKIISMPLLAVAFCLTPSLMSKQIAQQLSESGLFPSWPFRNATAVTSGKGRVGCPNPETDRLMGRTAVPS
jgi:hypothetical protein